jgi:hypothetical protein
MYAYLALGRLRTRLAQSLISDVNLGCIVSGAPPLVHALTGQQKQLIDS